MILCHDKCSFLMYMYSIAWEAIKGECLCTVVVVCLYKVYGVVEDSEETKHFPRRRKKNKGNGIKGSDII